MTSISQHLQDMSITYGEVALSSLSHTFDEIDLHFFQERFGHLLREGDVLDGIYEVRGLKVGAQGVVYFIWHRAWDVMLAMKTPHRRVWENIQGKQSFIKEAETWINLGKHVNVASAYFTKTINEIPRIFIEYADGGTLRDRLKINQYNNSWELQLDIAIQLTHGLKHAHSHNLVHRDLKPENILLWKNGYVKITDFGLTKIVNHERDASLDIGNVEQKQGGLFGTPAYMAPEQWQPQRHVDVGPAADIYALGVIFYELFAGQHPFQNAIIEPPHIRLETLKKCHLYEAPPPLQQIRKDMPEGLSILINACIAKEPQERPQQLETITSRLIDCFEEQTHKSYSRDLPSSITLLAADLNNRGVSWIGLDKDNEARQSFFSSLKIDPQFIQANYNLSLFRWRHGEISDEDVITSISALEHQGLTAIYYLGLIQLERGDLECALKQFLRALQLDSSHHGAHKYIAVTYLGLGQVTQANNAIERALALLPDDPDCIRFSNLIKGTHAQHLPNAINYRKLALHELKKTDELLAIDYEAGTTIFVARRTEVHEVDIITGVAKARASFPIITNKQIAYYYLGKGLLLLVTEENSTLGDIWNIRSNERIGTVPLPKMAYWDNKGLEPLLFKDKVLFTLSRDEDDNVFIARCVIGKNFVEPWLNPMFSINTAEIHLDQQPIVITGGRGQIDLWMHTHSGSSFAIKVEGNVRFVKLLPIQDPDALYILASGGASQFWLYRVEKGKDGHYFGESKCLQVFNGHSENVIYLAENLEARKVVSCGYDNTIRIWDLDSGVCLRTLAFSDQVPRQVGWFNNEQLAAFSNDNYMQGWALPNIHISAPFELSLPQTVSESLLFENEIETGLLLVRQLMVDGQTPKAYSVLRGLQQLPNSARERKVLDQLEPFLSLGNKSNISSSWLLARLETRFPVTAIAPVNNNEVLLISGGTLELWDWTKACKNAEFGHIGKNAQLIQFDHIKNKVATGGSQVQHLRLWNFLERKPFGMLPFGHNPWALGHLFGQVHIDGDWKRAISFPSRGDSLRDSLILWDLEIEEILEIYQMPSNVLGFWVNSSWSYGYAYLENNTIVKLGLDRGKHELYQDLTSFKGSSLTARKLARPTEAIFSKDGNKVLLLPEEGNTLAFANVLTKTVTSLQDGSKCNTGLFFDNDRLLVTASSSGIWIWAVDVEKGKVRMKWETSNDFIETVSMSDNGRYLYIGDNQGRVDVYEFDWALTF